MNRTTFHGVCVAHPLCFTVTINMTGVTEDPRGMEPLGARTRSTRLVNVLVLIDIASTFPRPASELLEGISRIVGLLDHLADGKTRVGYGWVSSGLAFIEDSVKSIDRPPSGKQGTGKTPGRPIKPPCTYESFNASL